MAHERRTVVDEKSLVQQEFEVTELDDHDLDAVSGGNKEAAGDNNTNCGCGCNPFTGGSGNGNCGCCPNPE
jgi:hypothetical protein